MMNDGISIADELSPELGALREARQRAAEARANAERLLREAQEAEARLLAQEEEAIVAATVQREREAHESIARLQAQIEQAASKKTQAEAAVMAIRASLAEHEEQLRNAEIHERALLSDLSIAERRAQEAARARELVLAGAVAAPAPGAAPAEVDQSNEALLPASLETIRAQRAAERRMADAARAMSI